MKTLLLTSIFFICFNSFATDQLTSRWTLLEIIENPHPEIVLQAFPESIAVEFTAENEGTITIKLSSQSKPKTYKFSNTVLKNPETVQFYNENREALKEQATTTYSQGILRVELRWIKLTCEERKEFLQSTETCPELVEVPEDIPQTDSLIGSYIFDLNGAELDFTRIDNKPEKRTTFKALYSLEE